MTPHGRPLNEQYFKDVGVGCLLGFALIVAIVLGVGLAGIAIGYFIERLPWCVGC